MRETPTRDFDTTWTLEFIEAMQIDNAEAKHDLVREQVGQLGVKSVIEQNAN